MELMVQWALQCSETGASSGVIVSSGEYEWISGQRELPGEMHLSQVLMDNEKEARKSGDILRRGSSTGKRREPL